jgi:hypothetical protein
MKTEATVYINYENFTEVSGYFKCNIDPTWLDMFLSLVNKINKHLGNVTAD